MSELESPYPIVRACRKPSSQSVTSSSLTNATGLAFRVNSGRTYSFRFTIVYQSNDTNTGIRFALTVPSSSRFAAIGRAISNTDGGAGEHQALLNSSGDAYATSIVQVANADNLLIIEGVIVPSQSGTLQVQFGNETGSATVTVYAGSCGLLWDLGP